MFWILMACQDGSNRQDTGTNIVLPEEDSFGYCQPSDASGLPEGNIECVNERCVIEEGAFWMGSDFAASECPVHEVNLSPFVIDQYEVTLKRWQTCVNRGGCQPLPDHCQNILERRQDYSTDFPAICITWTQARSFCTQEGGRLPTEAEWEKAAAGMSSAKWAWGGQSPTCEQANFRLATIYCAQGVRTVGHYDSPSAYGLYDVNGNVFEWTSDWYDAGYYEVSPIDNPSKVDGMCQDTIDAEVQECHQRVLRGGAYNTTEATIRNASRSAAVPDTVDVNIGFRCAYDL